MIAEEGTGRRGVIGEYLLAWTTDGDVDAAHPRFLIDGCVLVKEGVQRGLATVEGSPLVVRC
jgi:hypothetical protein